MITSVNACRSPGCHFSGLALFVPWCRQLTTYRGFQFPPHALPSEVKLPVPGSACLPLCIKFTPQALSRILLVLLTETLNALCSVFAGFPWLLVTPASVLCTHYSYTSHQSSRSVLVYTFLIASLMCDFSNPGSLESYKVQPQKTSLFFPASSVHN